MDREGEQLRVELISEEGEAGAAHERAPCNLRERERSSERQDGFRLAAIVFLEGGSAASVRSNSMA